MSFPPASLSFRKPLPSGSEVPQEEVCALFGIEGTLPDGLSLLHRAYRSFPSHVSAA